MFRSGYFESEVTGIGNLITCLLHAGVKVSRVFMRMLSKFYSKADDITARWCSLNEYNYFTAYVS